MTIYIRCRRTATAALCALALLAACTDHDDPTGGTAQPTPADALSATATLPAATGQTGSWGTTTRANSLIGPDLEYNTLTLYYPAEGDANGGSTLKAYAVPTDYITTPATGGSSSGTVDAKSFSFATAGTTLSSSDLYWQTVEKGYGTDATADFYLTLQQTDEPIPMATATMQASNVLWAEATGVAKRAPLNFSTPMKSRYARFTLIVKPGGGRTELDATQLTATIKTLPAAEADVANDADHIKEQAWPTAKDGSATTYNLIGTTAGATNTELASCTTTTTTDATATDTKFTANAPAAGSIYLAPQAVQGDNEALVVTYTHGDRPITEKIDLSKLKFSAFATTRGCQSPLGGSTPKRGGRFGEGGMPATRTDGNDFTAHTAGQHVVLTLILTVGTEAMPDAGGITVEDFCEAEDLTWDEVIEPDFPGYEIAADGTWEVWNANGLKAFANEVNSGKYELNCKLTDDIDLNTLPAADDNGSNWKPIANNYFSNPSNFYNGTFDGGGKTIRGINIKSTEFGYSQAFFGYLGENAVVKNLTMADGTIDSNLDAAAIAAKAKGATIVNCHNRNVTVISRAVQKSAGGIVASSENNAAITACTNTGQISQTDGGFAGGIVGYNTSNSPITACISTGNVTAPNEGGIVGINDNSTISACFWQLGDGIPMNAVVGGSGTVDADTKGIDATSNNGAQWAEAMTKLNAKLTTDGSEWRFAINPDFAKDEDDLQTKTVGIGDMPLIVTVKAPPTPASPAPSPSS